MFSDVFYGTLDDHGRFEQLPKRSGGYIRVRYDEFGSVWCCEHNCQLVQCRDGHETERQHNARRAARNAATTEDVTWWLDRVDSDKPY